MPLGLALRDGCLRERFLGAPALFGGARCRRLGRGATPGFGGCGCERSNVSLSRFGGAQIGLPAGSCGRGERRVRALALFGRVRRRGLGGSPLGRRFGRAFMRVLAGARRLGEGGVGARALRRGDRCCGLRRGACFRRFDGA
jgi:hypothetical protein